MKTDGELVKFALAGDLTAYPELIGRYMNTLYALGYQMSGDFHFAQDIAQETLVKGYFQLSSLKEPEKFGSWIYAIARRTCIDWQRKNRRETAGLHQAADLAETVTVEEAVEARIRQKAVWQALRKLRPSYRETAILHLMSGLSAPQIGRLLHVSVSAVESRIRRAKRQLRQELFELAEATLATVQLGTAFRSRVTSMLLQRLNCFYLPVRDPYTSALWYRDQLGLSASRTIEPGCQGASLTIGSGMEIYLLQSTGPAGQLSRPFELLSFEVDHLESLAERLRNQGVGISTVERGTDRLQCRLADPDGHFFILTQYL